MESGGRGNASAALARRDFLRAAGLAGASLMTSQSASASRERYETVVDVVEEGADDTGGESINSVLEGVREDSLLLEFPEGEYAMDRQFRHTGFDEFGMVGNGATVVPVPADEWNDDEKRLFRLGTYANPGGDLRVEGFTFDYTAPDTGLRAVEAQVASPSIRRVTVRGKHDTGNWGPGPMLVDVTDPDGTGRIERVHLKGGGAFQNAPHSASRGPIGFSVTPYHRGSLEVFDCEVFGFPSNGFYCSTEGGTVVVRGGRYRNNDVANIRLSGPNSRVEGANVIVDENPDSWVNQRGIRLDGGHGFVLDGVVLRHPKPNGAAIRLTNDVERTRIENATITMGDDKSDAISISDDAGPVDLVDSNVTMDGRGQAIQIDPGNGSPVSVRNVRIDGDARGGAGGSHAIRCERDDCEFRWVQVDQPGPDDRRCVTVDGDSCLLVGGTYESTHHPIVVNADGVDVRNVTARAYDGSEGVEVYGGHRDVDVVDSAIVGGIENRGSDLGTARNEYPVS